MASEEKKSSILQELWDRRFFQYLGTYLGLSFGLIQFADFLSNRYDLGANLVDKVFIFLLALLPAVAVFIYNHGRKGHDQWRPFEKIFIPASLVLGLTLAVVLFNDSTAKAATEEISITNLEGASETRLVPKVEFTKRFTIFPFENLSGNEDLDWMRTAMPFLLDKDMEQFMLNYAIHPFGMKGQYDNFNVDFLSDIPFSTQLKIAQEYYSDYLIIGGFEQQEDKIKLSAEVHNTKNGKIFFEKEVVGEDIYDVVDLFSAALDEYIYLKDNLATLDVVDLPASNLVTPNPEALKAFIEGMSIFGMDVRKVNEGIARLEKSVELDPTCGTCYSQLSRMYFSASNEAKMKEASEKAVSMIDALPERQRLMINFYHYNTENDWEKGIMLLNNWRQLYPSDYTPYSYLVTYYLQRLFWGKAEEVALQALENGHQGNLLYSLATIYISKGEFDTAEKYIDQYYELYPHKSKDQSLLEKIYSGRGELKKAKELYENSLVMDPNNVDMLVKVGTLEDQLGNFSESMKNFQEAMRKSKNPQDSVKAYIGIEGHFERLGQYQKSFDLSEKRKALMGKYLPPPILKQQYFFGQALKYVYTGRKESYFALLQDLQQELPQNAALFDCVGNYLYYLWAEELESFEKYSDQCLEEVIIPVYGKEFKYIDAGGKAEMQEDYEKAINQYRTYIDSTGQGDLRMSAVLASVHRKNGDFEKALEQIEEVLKLDPHQPSTLLEKAKILKGLGKQDEALQFYEKAMEIWKNSDEFFKTYKDALEFGEKLKAGSS